MAPSILAAMARHFVIDFFRQYVSTGCVIFKEEEGKVFTFKGNMDKCPLTVVVKVHTPQFYFKVMTQPHHFGFQSAYIDRDFSCEDEDDGLLNLFLIFSAIREYDSSPSRLNQKRRGWGLGGALFKATIAFGKFLLKPFLRPKPRKTPELSTEFFKCFTDETMQVSCPVFKELGEASEVAHRRKMSALINKVRARIEKDHEVLEIGCGVGLLGFEIVKRTGCKYTGVEILSEQQLKFAEAKVKEAGLESNVKFISCDFLKLPKTTKYDRIICCEVLEQIGNERIEEFFGCCDSLLAEDGLMVHQVMSISENILHKKIQSPGFMNEYIVPSGGWIIPSKMLSGMAKASNLCVEHMENIGPSFYRGLTDYRKRLVENKSKVMAMGFDDMFLRTWAYYFDYMAAGYKTRWCKNYQVVYARPENFTALGEPYQGFPSAYSC